MSDQEMRAFALTMAHETVGKQHYMLVLEAANQFYRFLSNARDDDEIFERVMRGKS